MAKRDWKFDRVTVAAAGGVMVALVVANGLFATRSSAAPSGDKIYATNCAGCHADGGNGLDPSKPVKGSKKLASKDAFKVFLAKANGAMPSFPKIAGNDEALTALHAYCKSLK